MSCVLTTDMAQDCRDGIGGNEEGFFIEFENIESMTITAGVVTAIDKATGKFFRKYKFPRETASAASPIQADEKNGSLYFNHEVKIVINKLSSLVRNEVIILAKNRLVAVMKDMNGKYWMLGRGGGILVTGGNLGTGTAFSDRNGTDLDFMGAEKEPMIEVDAATALTLQTPGS